MAFISMGSALSPVSMDRSSVTELSRCALESVTPQQQKDMLQCSIQCLLNPCCRAVNLTTCEQLYVNSDAYDIVKEVGTVW